MSPLTPVTALHATLCDLRTQCERQIAAVIDALQALQQHREVPDARADTCGELKRDFAALASAHKSIGQALTECERLMVELPSVEDSSST